MDMEFAHQFVNEWIAGWNSHDLERILAHYTDDVVFCSPNIVEWLGRSSGCVEGKEELRAYWSNGLQRQTSLHFTLEDVRISVDTIVINYRNQLGIAVAEVLRFRDGRVSWGCGAYAPPENGG